MPTLTRRVPTYCRHRASGQATVTLNGQVFYLGRYNSQQSKTEYDRRIAEWIAAGRRPATAPDAVTVGEVVLAYVEHAKSYYRRADGTETGEASRVARELTPLAKLYHATPATEFGPLRLKVVRNEMIKLGWVRSSINHAIGTVVRAFRFVAGNEMLSAEVFHALKAVEGLKRGRSGAPDSEPVKPVPLEYVYATMQHVSRHVAAMIQLQLTTGMRSGELIAMRGRDLDTSGKLWVYRPSQHKTVHHGHMREVFLGHRARRIIEPFLKPNPLDYLFDPREATAEQRAIRHAQRRTPMNEGNKPCGRQSERIDGVRYTSNSYRRAIVRGCDLADRFARGGLVIGNEERVIPRWHPHQLRHNFATEMRKNYGVESTLVMLGDKSTRMIDVYAEKNRDAALRIVAEVG